MRKWGRCSFLINYSKTLAKNAILVYVFCSMLRTDDLDGKSAMKLLREVLM